ncbi:MAG: hypothetical protein HOV94_39030, partial [Saccharothrix sp.]|nr:hypothetical protein [Saccharothrix sp.]
MRARRPGPRVAFGQLALVLALPILINVATGVLPAFLGPYLWFAWPVLVVAAVWIVVTSLRRPAAGAVAATRDIGASEAGSTWNVPETTRAFITRQAVVNRLDRVLAGASPRAVLVGMPGVGKSEAAAAYARASRDAVGIGWWVVADTRLAVVVALATLADRLGVGGDDQESAARRVLDLLDDRADVLLVYDNADAPEELAGLLPTGRCRVLLTSRNPDVARIAEPIAVEPFTLAQAARFLRLRTGDDDKEAARRLADSTGCLPLALEQIAGYCAASDLGLADYADRYRTGRRTLLRARAPGGRTSVEVAIGLAL